MPKVLKMTGFQYFLQYLKKELSDEVDFLHAYKHQSFLQVHIIYFDRFGQKNQKYPDKLAIDFSQMKITKQTFLTHSFQSKVLKWEHYIG